MEEKFIRLADLQKFPLRKDHYDKEHGNEHFIYGIETVFEYIDELPKYEIAVQSEGNFTTEEVVMGLECCQSEDIDDCRKCPYVAESTEELFCDKKLMKDALVRMKQSGATIEFLRKTIRENEQRHLEAMLERNDEVAVEVAREILKEIDESTKYFRIPNGCAVISLEKLDELKKKYTEVGNGN